MQRMSYLSVSSGDMSHVHGCETIFGVVCAGADQEQAIALILAPYNTHTRTPPPYWDFLFHHKQGGTDDVEEEQWIGGSSPFAVPPKSVLPSLLPVQLFSRLGPTHHHHPGALGLSLLHYACLYGQLRVVRVLLGMGIDPNLPAANYDRHRPLHLAAMKSSAFFLFDTHTLLFF